MSALRKSVFLLTLLVGAACRHESDLPKLFPVPPATLIDETGKPFSLASTKGSVTVYNFIFTNCTGTCPIMTTNMRALTKKVWKDAPVRFISISVDPRNDTPAVLAEYARKVRNDARWTFLTGSPEEIVKLSVDGFKLAASATPQPGAEPLLHSSKFAVADRHGVIREYYGGTDGDVAQHVSATIEDLLREQ
jgi:protein SCO1/2